MQELIVLQDLLKAKCRVLLFKSNQAFYKIEGLCSRAVLRA